jgi:PHD/YefM family antitoxin component YafN of YafNO toxin-antitoxin module
MKTMSYTESRGRYAEVLDSVTEDREEVVITRAGHEPARCDGEIGVRCRRRARPLC